MVRRRGQGTSVFRANTFRRIADARYPPLVSKEELIKGDIEDIVHESGRGTPLVLIRFENGKRCYLPAPEGLGLHQTILHGESAVAEIGNILPLEKVPEGTMVCNIELAPGDGGKIAKSSGAYATVVAHTLRGTELKLPSGKGIYADGRCRATIGVISSAGTIEKPFLTAGRNRAYKISRGKRWPVSKGQRMVAASHPHGGGRHKHAGKPTTVSRDTPPGRKVGMIAARQTGRASQRMRRRAVSL